MGMRKGMMVRGVMGAAAVLCVAFSGFAEVKQHGLFTENAVLQSGMEVPVWGTAGDGEQVTVEVAGKTATATAKGGKWMAKLPSMEPGGPYEMTIKGPANTITVKNVMVGDVWLVSGQSNMGLGLGKGKDSQAVKEKSADPKLRFFFVAMRGSTEPLSDVQGRWMEASAYSTHMSSAVGYFFMRDLRAAKGVPMGMIQATVGGTYADTWIPQSYLDKDPAFKVTVERWDNFKKAYDAAIAKFKQDEPELKKAWEAEAAKAKAEGKKEPAAPQQPQTAESDPRCRPSNQYNGLIATLHPYAIKGAAWYQGENDAGTADYYRLSLPTMIKSWRDLWGQGNFPFLIVQLPPCGNILKEPAARAEWAEMRESQEVISKTVPNAALVCTIDLGDEANPLNLHPPKKQPIGERLAVAARALAYGEKVEYTGPVFDKVKFGEGKAVVSFKHVGEGLRMRGAGGVKGFAVAGEDKKFVFAEAVIEGDTVVVYSPSVSKPVAVRYAWDNYPVCNLESAGGLPALPFRTDDYPVK